MRMIILMIGLAHQDDGVTTYDYRTAYAYETVKECTDRAEAENLVSDQHAYCTLEVFAPETSPRPIARVTP